MSEGPKKKEKGMEKGSLTKAQVGEVVNLFHRRLTEAEDIAKDVALKVVLGPECDREGNEARVKELMAKAAIWREAKAALVNMALPE